MFIRINQFRKIPQGMSLTEVVIVLGISSLLTVASLAWFQTQKTNDFYDQMRQIESQIRAVQSKATSNIVPGFSNASADCDNASRTNCVLNQDEQVFGSAVAIQRVAGANDTIKVYYLKSTKPNTTSKKSEGVVPYGPGPSSTYSETIVLPANVRFDGYRVYFQDAASKVCLRDPASLDWVKEDAGLPATKLDFSSVNPIPNLSNTSLSGYSMMVFRRQPNAYYTFWDSASSPDIYSTSPFLPTGYDPVLGLPAASLAFQPRAIAPNEFNNTTTRGTTNAKYFAAYDPTYIAAPAGNPNAPMKSQPCAVSWRFGTLDLTNPTTPRQSAEIVFDIAGGSTILKTR